MLPQPVREAIRAAAIANGYPIAHLEAVVDVESGGRVYAFTGRTLPVILFEPHIFYRRLSGAQRDFAVAQGLAYERWGARPYPRTQRERYTQLEQAMLINRSAAIESASWGVGQVLGQNWQSLGYASVDDFYAEVTSGIEGQIEAMVRFIKHNGLDDDLIAGNWRGFARGYNGPSYERNAYHTKLADAVRYYGGASAVSEPNGMLRLGARGARVRELQQLLSRAGYQIQVDGDFGPATRDALRAFQQREGLVVDGIYGPATERALGAFRQGQDDRPGNLPAHQNRDVLSGAGTAGGAIVIEGAQQRIDEATAGLQQYAGNQWIDYGLTALTVLAAALAVAGIAWMVWGFIKARRTVEA